MLLVSHYADGAWYAAVLERSGHKVDWTVAEADYTSTLKGIIPTPLAELPEDVTGYDLIVFDDASHGSMADAMREVTPVIGSSSFAQRLENDRLFGIEYMEQCGIPVPPYESFDDIGKALKWLKKNGHRCVFKPSGTIEDKSLTYCAKSAEDMQQYLEKLDNAKIKEFVLQEFVEGTEVSTDAWFNGNEFIAMCHTLEEKKFLAGGLGPNTGCSGCVVWMLEQPDHLYVRGLGKAREQLMAEGFVGPIDLNTIATDNGIYGLEWTPRIGYEGTCNLTRLLPMEFGEFLHGIATGEAVQIAGSRYNFAATIRISVPPYPNPSRPSKYAGIHIKGIEPEQVYEFYLKDVLINDAGEMETLGIEGFIGAPIGCADSIKQAFQECETAIKRIEAADLQYRVDLAKCCEKRFEELHKNGWLKRAN